MRARFLCDENIEAETVTELADRGIESRHASELPGAGSSDATVASTANDLDAVLITNDDDFLDSSTFPDVQVFYVPENELPAYRVARRVDTVIELEPDLPSLSDKFFLTEVYEDL